MADIDDVLGFLAGVANGAVYPNGSTSPSIANVAITIGKGWPAPNDLTEIVAASPQQALVTVFPTPGSAAKVEQVWESPQVIIPAVHGMSATIAGQVATFTGAPGSGEFASLVVDGRYSYSRTGATLAAIMTALIADVIVNYPTATLVGSAITIPSAHTIEARIGAPATMGQVLHRQEQSVMVTVWAPSPMLRTQIAQAIDLAIKANVRVSMPDTSQALVVYERTTIIDQHEVAGIYRRDLVYSVEYATIDQFQAFEVTSVNASGLAPQPLVW